VEDFVSHGGRIKKKRLQQLLDLLKSSSASTTNIFELNEGSNLDKELDLCVITTISSKDQSPASFLCLDKSGQLLVLSIYFLKVESIRFTAENFITVVRPTVLPCTPNRSTISASGTVGVAGEMQSSIYWVQADSIANIKVAGSPLKVNNTAAPQLRLESFDS
jgi:hypothetical protein